jgi:hypothetical protein
LVDLVKLLGDRGRMKGVVIASSPEFDRRADFADAGMRF